MKKFSYLLIAFFILSITLFSQTNIDNLEKSLSQFTGTNKEKVDILNKLAKEYLSISPERTVEYGKQALKLSKKINYKKGESKSLENIGVGHTHLSNYNKALEYFLKFLRINEKIRDKRSISISLNNIGNVYCELGNYDKALEYLLKSLNISEGIGHKNGVANSLNSIGNIYCKTGNFDKALKYFLLSLTKMEEMGNKKGISVSLNYIGTVYWYLTNFDKALEYYLKSLKINEKIGDKNNIVYSLNNVGIVYHKLKNYNKALKYYLKSLKIYKEIGNKNGVASLLNNIGVIYKDSDKYDKALECHLKSLKIFKDIGNKNGIAISLKNTGEIYSKLNKYDQAVLYLEQGLKLAKQIDSKDLIKDCYEAYFILFNSKSNYKKALKYYLLYSEVKDSIFTKESNKKIAEMQTKYETEKKEKEIEILRKDKEIQNSEIIRQKSVRNSFIAISGLILVLVLVIYSRYHTKKKANKILSEKNIQITEQKNQLSQTLSELRETQKILVDTAHRAGIAEIASGILHNVGNVLNSVKVSSQLLREKIEKSKVNELHKVLDLINQHTTDFSDYITSDKKGKIIPAYLVKAGKILRDEQNSHLNELSMLINGINHIEEIVTVQQNYAGVSGVVESIPLSSIMDDVLKMYQDTFKTHMIEVVKHYKDLLPVLIEKGKLMQVFVNLLKNAQESLVLKGDKKKVITINISEDKEGKHQIVEIIDNGVGIKKDQLEQIFSYEFTTKKGSQGLGLHTSALTIAEMGGKIVACSEGEGMGVTFTVILPENKQ